MSLIILLLASTIFPWARVFIEESYAQPEAIIELPDTRLAWFFHFTFDSTKSALIFSNAEGDSLQTIAWTDLYIKNADLVDDSTHIAISGHYFPYHPDSAHIFIYKTTLDGDSVSFWDYSITGDDDLQYMYYTQDNGFLITKNLYPADSICFLKIDQFGEIEWQRTYDFGFISFPGPPSFASDSTIFFPMGWYDSLYNIQPMLLHLDQNGDIIAWKRWQSGIENKLRSLVIINDSTLLICGDHRPIGGWVNDIWIGDFDFDLNFRREKRYEFFVNSYAMNPILLPNEDIIMEFKSLDDIGLILFDPETFDTVWTTKWITPDTLDYCGTLCRAANGDYCIASPVEIGSTILKNRCIRVDSLGNHVPSSIDEIPELPSEITISAHPNPFNSAVKISVEQTFLSVHEGVQTGMSGLPMQIEVFDINGRRIDVISTERSDEKSPTNPQEISPFGRNDIGKSVRNDIGGEYIWQPNDDLPSGVYLVRAKHAGTTRTTRVVYLK